MHVMTVGVAAPHRGRGLGTALLGRALAGAADDPAIGGAYLHAHAPNAAAIAFYERLGFVRGATVPGYYRRLRPPDAVLLERRLR
jgi:ribosomal protein S18 acetylase RimI-like enzyme